MVTEMVMLLSQHQLTNLPMPTTTVAVFGSGRYSSLFLNGLFTTSELGMEWRGTVLLGVSMSSSTLPSTSWTAWPAKSGMASRDVCASVGAAVVSLGRQCYDEVGRTWWTRQELRTSRRVVSPRVEGPKVDVDSAVHPAVVTAQHCNSEQWGLWGFRPPNRPLFCFSRGLCLALASWVLECEVWLNHGAGSRTPCRPGPGSLNIIVEIETEDEHLQLGL